MATQSAVVRKWPHVDCCRATAVNLHGYCSEEVALCWFIMFHNLKTSSLNTLNLVQFKATGSSHAESANNTDDVCHNNGDPHAANGGNQGSDNNGDHAPM